MKDFLRAALQYLAIPLTVIATVFAAVPLLKMFSLWVEYWK